MLQSAQPVLYKCQPVEASGVLCCVVVLKIVMSCRGAEISSFVSHCVRVVSSNFKFMMACVLIVFHIYPVTTTLSLTFCAKLYTDY